MIRSALPIAAACFLELVPFDGKWKAIECYQPYCIFLPATFSLRPKEQWSAVAPVYCGSFPTRLRLRLMTSAGPLYEFPGSVNGMQFRFRYPARIDPYAMSRANRVDRFVVHQHLGLDLGY